MAESKSKEQSFSVFWFSRSLSHYSLITDFIEHNMVTRKVFMISLTSDVSVL